MELKRKIRLHTFFIRYAVWVMIGAVVILTAALLLFSAGIETGWILPANYAEGMLTGRARQIQSAERVTEDLIPETCRYGVYDREGTYLYGTFEKEEREDAWEIYREGERGNNKDFLFFIPATSRHPIIKLNELVPIRYQKCYNIKNFSPIECATFPNQTSIAIVYFC